jgi:hypothetical protein
MLGSATILAIKFVRPDDFDAVARLFLIPGGFLAHALEVAGLKAKAT